LAAGGGTDGGVSAGVYGVSDIEGESVISRPETLLGGHASSFGERFLLGIQHLRASSVVANTIKKTKPMIAVAYSRAEISGNLAEPAKAY